MQYSLYAFIPFGVLLGIALIAALISLWTGAGWRGNQRILKQPHRSAEIIYFPGRREQSSATLAARTYLKG